MKYKDSHQFSCKIQGIKNMPKWHKRQESYNLREIWHKYLESLSREFQNFNKIGMFFYPIASLTLRYRRYVNNVTLIDCQQVYAGCNDLRSIQMSSTGWKSKNILNECVVFIPARNLNHRWRFEKETEHPNATCWSFYLSGLRKYHCASIKKGIIRDMFCRGWYPLRCS